MLPSPFAAVGDEIMLNSLLDDLTRRGAHLTLINLDDPLARHQAPQEAPVRASDSPRRAGRTPSSPMGRPAPAKTLTELLCAHRLVLGQEARAPATGTSGCWRPHRAVAGGRAAPIQRREQAASDYANQPGLPGIKPWNLIDEAAAARWWISTAPRFHLNSHTSSSIGGCRSLHQCLIVGLAATLSLSG